MAQSRRGEVKKDLIFLGGLIVLAAALVLYLVREPADDRSASTSAATIASTSAGDTRPSIERRLADDPLALGNPNAPVAMVVFSDYRCPFCAKFSRDTEPLLVDRYVNNGTLRIEWRDFPIFGDQSILAAHAGRAAAAQGKFWEFNRAVFAAAPERGHHELDENALIVFAEQAGVADLDRFTADMRSTAFDTAINTDRTQGDSIGVPSTPAFMINGVPLLGAQPSDEFIRAIDAAAGTA